MKNFEAIKITPYINDNDYCVLGATSGSFGPEEQAVCNANYMSRTWPTPLFDPLKVNDLSGNEDWPVSLCDGVFRGATFISSNVGTGLLANKQIAFPDVNKLLVRRSLVWETWNIIRAMPSEASPESSVEYTPDYSDTWRTEALLSGFDVTHPGLLGTYWREDEHHSYVEVVKSNCATDDWRIKLCRARIYTPMKVPDYCAHFQKVNDDYRLTWRSQHVSQEGEIAKFIMEIATDSGFTADKSVYVGDATLIQHWDDELGIYVYDYHEIKFYPYLDYSKTWYIRCKRRDELITDPNTYSDSDWCSTLIIYKNRSNALMLNNSPDWIPYYCYREYFSSFQLWMVAAGTWDEDVIKIRIQIGTTDTFTTLYLDETRDATYSGKFESIAGLGITRNIPLGIYYIRVRGENADGSVVSEWSNVFELNSTIPVSRYNGEISYTGDNYYGETHDTSVEGFLSERAFLADDTLSYAIVVGNDVLHNRIVDLYTVTSSGYNKTTLDLNATGNFVFIKFGGKVYVGYTDNDQHFVWRDVTGGIIGEAHILSLPDDAYSFEWVTLANIYGKLEVVASIGYF